MKLAACFGGGVNSAAMLIEMNRRGLRPDVILFADTGGERPETYEFVGAFSAWLIAHDMEPITTVRATGELLEENCLRREALPAITYGFKTCSLRWKADPQEKYLNAWSKGEFYRKAIGFDAGEPQRAKPYRDKKCEAWYPLVAWDLDRDDCEAICESEGLNVAKSSCFFCPNMKRHEVIALSKEHPDLYARAVAMERNANLTELQGLGRNWRWADVHLQLSLFEIDRPYPCECYDG